VLIKILLALVALAALVMLVSPVPVDDGATALQRSLYLAGVSVASIGMIVPWGRWLSPDSPGRGMGIVCKALGWGCASELPAAIAFGNAPVALACAFVCVAWIGLWKRQAWAPWAFYAIGLVPLVACIATLVAIFSSSDLAVAGFEAGGFYFVALCAVVGVAFWREVTAWQRTRRAAGAPASPSAR